MFQDGPSTVTEYEYDNLGRRTKWSKTFCGNDVNTVYEYDIADRLTKLTNNIGDSNITFEYISYNNTNNKRDFFPKTYANQ